MIEFLNLVRIRTFVGVEVFDDIVKRIVLSTGKNSGRHFRSEGGDGLLIWPDVVVFILVYRLIADDPSSKELRNRLNFLIAVSYTHLIMDLKTLLTIAVTIICDGKTFDIAELNRLEGFANATFN